MSAIVVLPVLIPVGTVVWPLVATAAVAAGTALGFVSASASAKVKTKAAVEVSMENSEAVGADVALGQELVFVKGDIRVVIGRDARGKLSVKVHGESQSKEELRALGKEFCDRLAQQYAYHRLVTEMKARNFNVVGEEVEQDGTVRVHVRIFQE